MALEGGCCCLVLGFGRDEGIWAEGDGLGLRLGMRGWGWVEAGMWDVRVRGWVRGRP